MMMGKKPDDARNKGGSTAHAEQGTVGDKVQGTVGEDGSGWKKSGMEARARTVKKPSGESSFQEESNYSKWRGQAEEGGGIKHVLSDLKRSIVESSRVICDKSFQSQYDLVTDERGIL